MLKSMTGYGGATGVSGKREITVEVRSVNNRFLDCNIRMPRIYTAAEDMLRSEVQRWISRGKVDVYITIDASRADDTAIKVNEPLADAFFAALTAISARYHVPNSLTALDIARFQEVLSVEKAETDTDALYADIVGVLSAAMEKFTEMRIAEGEKLRLDIGARLDKIEDLTLQAETLSPHTVASYHERLLARMTDVLKNTEIEESRILTEAALFADKVAINEEVVRLKSHIAQLRDMLNSDEPSGRKLDFLVQEMNREANTIGSKGNHVDMARIIIDLKAEIEKIREQAQNVE